MMSKNRVKTTDQSQTVGAFSGEIPVVIQRNGTISTRARNDTLPSVIRKMLLRAAGIVQSFLPGHILTFAEVFQSR